MPAASPSEHVPCSENSMKKPTIQKPKASGLIYCDGAAENGQMGIGVYSDDFGGIDEGEVIDTPSSNNVAECLALKKALELSEAKGISGAEYLCDSELVVRWVTGEYGLKSETAQTYVPELRTRLVKVGGTIRWIPGSTNKADAPSRRHFTVKESFGTLIKMKSGRDEFSKMRLPELQSRVKADAWERVVKEFASEQYQAVCLRWHLRGLDIETAIKKTQITKQMADKSRS